MREPKSITDRRNAVNLNEAEQRCLRIAQAQVRTLRAQGRTHVMVPVRLQGAAEWRRAVGGSR